MKRQVGDKSEDADVDVIDADQVISDWVDSCTWDGWTWVQNLVSTHLAVVQPFSRWGKKFSPLPFPAVWGLLLQVVYLRALRQLVA